MCGFVRETSKGICRRLPFQMKLICHTLFHINTCSAKIVIALAIKMN